MDMAGGVVTGRGGEEGRRGEEEEEEEEEELRWKGRRWNGRMESGKVDKRLIALVFGSGSQGLVQSSAKPSEARDRAGRQDRHARVRLGSGEGEWSERTEARRSK